MHSSTAHKPYCAETESGFLGASLAPESSPGKDKLWQRDQDCTAGQKQKLQGDALGLSSVLTRVFHHESQTLPVQGVNHTVKQAGKRKWVPHHNTRLAAPS